MALLHRAAITSVNVRHLSTTRTNYMYMRERGTDFYFARASGSEVLWWVCLSVCLSVGQDISGTRRAIFTKFFVHVVHVRTFTIGCIAYRRKGVTVPLTMHCNAIAASNVKPLQNSLPHHSKWDRPGREWRECTSRAKCNLRLACLSWVWDQELNNPDPIHGAYPKGYKRKFGRRR